MADVATKYGFGGGVVIGDQYTSVTISSTGSADVVSAAANTTGIIISFLSMSAGIQSNSSGGCDIQLKYDGHVIAEIFGSIINGVCFTNPYLGGFCNLEIPAGKAVSYTCVSLTNYQGTIILTWKHK